MEGKVFVVTGGGSGLGLALAEGMAAAGGKGVEGITNGARQVFAGFLTDPQFIASTGWRLLSRPGTLLEWWLQRGREEVSVTITST